MLAQMNSNQEEKEKEEKQALRKKRQMEREKIGGPFFHREDLSSGKEFVQPAGTKDEEKAKTKDDEQKDDDDEKKDDEDKEEDEDVYQSLIADEEDEEDYLSQPEDDEKQRPRLTSRKTIGRRSPTKPTSRGEKTTKKKPKIQYQELALLARYEALKNTSFTFSPGPNQVKPTMIMEKIKIEVERLVEEELKKRSKEESISKKLFPTDDERDHEADKLYRKRTEMTYEEDEK